MRLIDSDAFEKFIKEKYKDGESTDDIKDQMLFDLSYQPTVEAVPVVHGEWLKTFKSMVPNFDTGELEPKYSCDCSICKWHTGNQGTRFNFCPNCGADMRKKVG